MVVFIHPSFIVLFQILIISVITAFVIEKVSFYLKCKLNVKHVFSFWLFIPFCLPPVILLALNPIRTTLCSFLELLLIVELFFIFVRFDTFNIEKAIEFSLLIPIVSLWRTESIIYLIMFTILLLISTHKLITKKSMAVFISLLVCFTSAIYVPQKYSMMKSELDMSMFSEDNDPTVINKTGPIVNYENAYKIIGIASAFVYMTKVAYENNDPIIDEISTLFDVESICKETEEETSSEQSSDTSKSKDTYLVWSCGLYVDLTKEEVSKMYSIYIRLCLKYPSKAISRMLQNFLIGNGFNFINAEVFIGDSAKNPASSYGYGIIETEFCPSLRQFVITVLQCGSNGYPVFPFHIIYSVITPIFLLIFCFFYFLIKIKKRKVNIYKSLIALTLLIKFGLIIFTMPPTFFMYYLTFYIVGYFYICYLLAKIHSVRNATKKNSFIKNSKIVKNKTLKKCHSLTKIFKKRESVFTKKITLLSQRT
jgi:hypothetical protein